MAFNQIKTSIIDFEDGVFRLKSDQNLNLSDDNSVTGLGQIISSKACREMIERRFRREIEEPSENTKNDICAYEIGKEAILMILLQEGCEGVRFIHCINDDMEKSLVAMGIGKDGKPLKADKFSRENVLLDRSELEPILIEKIGRVSLGSLIKDFDTNPTGVDFTGVQKINHLTDKFINLL